MEMPRERGGVGWKARPLSCAFAGPEATITVSTHARTDRPAAGPRDRPKARHPLRDKHTDISLSLALQAHTVGRQARPDSRDQIRDDVEKLALIDRTAPQLEVHMDMLRDRRGSTEALNIFRTGIDRLLERFDIGPVAQRLNAAGRRAGPDRDQYLRLLSYGENAMRILCSRDRSFHQGDIVRAGINVAGRLREVGDVQSLA